MNEEQIEKKFPSYFSNFEIPKWEREQELEVYRAIKRFMKLDSRYGVPFVIAKGITKPIHGICLETKEWKAKLGIKYKGSHVDWWLYENARPWEEFEELIQDEC